MSPGIDRLRIGTRGSALALWQARHVAERLGRLEEAPAVELIEIETEGDRIVDRALSTLPGKAFFTKEIERALLDGEVDMAVHSLKDLATEAPDGLEIGAVLERQDPRDALVSRTRGGLDELPAGARIGTSSLRRRALLGRWRPDLEVADLRGNVPTRIDKLDAGRYDAIVLATAGLARLGLDHRVSSVLSADRFLPAVAQGAIAVQVRSSDAETLAWVRRLEHAPTRSAVTAERALLGRLEGGCQIPVGALGTVEEDRIELRAIVCSLDGRESVEDRAEGHLQRAAELGRELAEKLLGRGAEEILARIRSSAEEAR